MYGMPEYGRNSGSFASAAVLVPSVASSTEPAVPSFLITWSLLVRDPARSRTAASAIRSAVWSPHTIGFLHDDPRPAAEDSELVSRALAPEQSRLDPVGDIEYTLNG